MAWMTESAGSTRSLEGKSFVVLLVETIVVDVMGGAEEDAAKGGEERGVFEVRVDYSAEQSPVYYFYAERHLNQGRTTMKSFLNRSHWNSFL